MPAPRYPTAHSNKPWKHLLRHGALLLSTLLLGGQAAAQCTGTTTDTVQSGTVQRLSNYTTACSGNLTIASGTLVSALVVGGGGGGGGGRKGDDGGGAGAGGGGGGVVLGSVTSSGTVSIAVGAGGTKGIYSDATNTLTAATGGGTSTLGSLVASGGGGGGSHPGGSAYSVFGGAGGGGSGGASNIAGVIGATGYAANTASGNTGLGATGEAAGAAAWQAFAGSNYCIGGAGGSGHGVYSGNTNPGAKGSGCPGGARSGGDGEFGNNAWTGTSSGRINGINGTGGGGGGGGFVASGSGQGGGNGGTGRVVVNYPLASLAQSTLGAGSTNLATGGAATTITLQLKTAAGVDVPTGTTLPVVFTVNNGAATLSAFTNHGDGTYTATLTPVAQGTVEVSATLGGVVVGNTVQINIITVPVANNVTHTATYGGAATAVTLNITAATPVSVAVATQASHGTATASGTGITYAPAAGYAGLDSFTYTASNAGGMSAAATVSVMVNPVAPGAPTAATATAGNGQATVSFTAPGFTGGASITSYTVTSNPGGFTGTGTSSPIAVSGLANGTSYTFTVTATNSAGTGAASAASNSVTPKAQQTISFATPGAQNFGTSPTLTATAPGGAVTFTSATTGVCTITSGGALSFVTAGNCTINADQAGNSSYLPAPQVGQTFTVNAALPGAPAAVTATAGDGEATVSFTAPSDTGGAPITGYEVAVNPPDVGPVSGTGSPVTVTGLTNGVSYTFTVKAENTAGWGADSAGSNAVVPRLLQMTSAPDAVPGMVGTATATLAGGGPNCTLLATGGFGPATQVPPQMRAPYGQFSFTASHCNSDPLTITLHYPEPLPVNVAFRKPNGAGGWFDPQNAATSLNLTLDASRTTVTYNITDNALGDADPTPGTISDPLLPVVPLAAGSAAAIPTLSEWTLVLLSVLLGLLGILSRRPVQTTQ